MRMRIILASTVMRVRVVLVCMMVRIRVVVVREARWRERELCEQYPQRSGDGRAPDPTLSHPPILSVFSSFASR